MRPRHSPRAPCDEHHPHPRSCERTPVAAELTARGGTVSEALDDIFGRFLPFVNA